MIQDIGNHIYNNDYQILTPSKEDFVLAFKDNNILTNNILGSDTLMRKKDYDSLGGDILKFTYVFKIDDMLFFIVDNPEDIKESETFEWFPMTILRTITPDEFRFAAVTAAHINSFYKNNRFCGKCGNVMVKGDKERSLVCPHCKNTIYPRISPAVIVGIIDGEKIVLTKYKGRNFKKYALIAGFVEAGEALEATVKREVLEEVGLKVKNIRYYDNQPWGFSNSILMGFFADLDGDNKIKLEEDELSVGEWVNREDIPCDNENNLSLTYKMMNAFKNGYKNN